jgi:alkanesulfonate monooxygenase SsuD/methylene tetrahydromethanopterin reductase-like flavin-dependent oxidoreductase (luciferase family)
MTQAGLTSPQLRFGICTDQNLPWEALRDQWRLFEQLGFESAWVCDHFQQPSRPNGPYHEGWTLLAALAAATTTIRVGVLVSSNTFRHPALLAKQAVTVDHVSGGRLELGIGTGWFKPEHEAFGLEFPQPKELVDRFVEAVTIVDLMLTHDLTTFDGRHYRLKEAPCRPAPLQRPRPPLTLGAHAPRMLGIAARFADRWNSHGSVEEIGERNRILDDACDAHGRDRRAVIRSLYGWASLMPHDPWDSPDAFQDMVGRYREVGIEEFIVDAPRPEQFATMERIASEVMSREP